MWKLSQNHDFEAELRKVVVATLQKMMDENPQVVALEADLGGASSFTSMKKTHPNQFIQCGISEANMVGMAAGMSILGYRPFVHTFAPFATRRVHDQLFLSAAYSNNDINIYGSDPGFTSGPNGGTHTSLEDIALLRPVPGAIITDAADKTQLEWILREFSKRHGVKYVRANRKAVRKVYEDGSTFKLGEANVLKEGQDVLIITAGQLCYDALMCAEKLASQNIQATIVDMFCIKPLDVDCILKHAVNKKLIVSFENHSIIGGLGSAVAEVLAENQSAIPFIRIGTKDHFGEVGTPNYLQEKYGLTSEQLENTIVNFLKEER